ncbi:hypothetical protein RJT34_30033 [Clitoria ternatea]|uniref:Uncharacterized protein n=1 Tax=Clitoria ternatea TaxID=43366 RepID=A0AAN9ETS7_CLITE
MKSKSKSKGGKDQRKATPKTSGVTNNGSGIPTTHAYNPISGTFHTLETVLGATSTPTHDKSRFQNIDDPDELPSSLQGTVSECDSVSNNDSCSGESEDPKEKILNHSIRPDNVPGDVLAQISDIEVRYNCSKQEVERVVVACEGDLQKAENTLKSQKLESSVTQPKAEDDSTQISGLMMRSQGLPIASISMQ